MPFFPGGGGGASGNQNPGPNLIPQSLSSGLLAGGWGPAKIPDNERYVSASGNDANLGDDWSRPLKYFKTAWTQLLALGGGTIYVTGDSANPCPIQSNGKGMYITDPRVGATPTNSVLPMPVRVVGVSKVGSVGFEYVPQAFLSGGADESTLEQDDPGLWISESIAEPMAFENIRIAGQRNKPIRLGWDYPRDVSTGAIIKQNVTGASRAAGSTVFTVDPYTYNFVRIARTTNIVTITPEWTGPVVLQAGMHVFVNYTDANFTGGWFTVLGTTRVDGSHNDDSFTITSVGSDFVEGTTSGPTIATIQSTLVKALDYITLYATDGDTGEFPSSQYEVTAINQATITCTDYYGYSPRSATASASNIGTYAAQDRLRHTNAKLAFRNVGGTPHNGDASTERFVQGPGLDCAGLEFFRFDDLFVDGFNLAAVSGQYGCRDPGRRAAGRFDCGSSTTGIGFGAFGSWYCAYGGLRYKCSSASTLIVRFDTVCSDIPVGGGFLGLPVFELLNGVNSHCVYIEQVSTVDTSGVLAVKANLGSPWDCLVCNVVYGGIEGPCTVICQGVGQIQSGLSHTPNYYKQTGYYGYDRSIAGRHAASARSGSPVSAPIPCKGLVPADPASWSTTGLTVTTGIRDPWGGTTAVRISNSSGSAKTAAYVGRHFGSTSNPGDIYAAAAFVRGDSGSGHAFRLDVVDTGVSYLAETAKMPRVGSGEWECVSAGARLSAGISGSASVCTMETQIADGASIDICCPQAYFLPIADATDVTDDELAEIITHLQPQNDYIDVNCVGTRVGQKFIGFDGFGTNSANKKTVGVGSGQLTLTGTGTVYLPTYDKDGSTIIGWVAQLQATVNP